MHGTMKTKLVIKCTVHYIVNLQFTSRVTYWHNFWVATAVSVFIRLWCMDDKISWLGGWASQWCTPQGLSEHKHCDNAATTKTRTARTLEAEWWQVCGEAWVRRKRKMSQVLSAFRLLDFAVLRPVLAWRAFWSLWTLYFFNFPRFFFRPR